MPRTSRSIVGGYCYQVINRGNAGARVFHDPTDYLSFLALVRESQQRFDLPMLAACLMPNHVHFVVRPHRDDDVARWTHWLFTTHVRRHHMKYRTHGRIWQGRFKAFLIQEDHHLVAVLRYVERNAARAQLVNRAERWPWGSLSWRIQLPPRISLTPSPVPLPRNWIEYVNTPQTPTELDAIRACVNRQHSFGS